MFKYLTAFSSFSVNDLASAKKFYSNILGLKVTEDNMGFIELHIDKNQKVLVYPKEDHIPATFTVLNFPVENIEKAVDELTDQEVVFEQYEGALKTDEKGIMRGEGPNIAWFKDPAGNILSIIEN